MAIYVACTCGKHFEAGDEHAGKQTKCPACGRPLIIPTPGTGPPASPPAAPRTPPLRTRNDDDDEGGTYAVNAEDAALPGRLRGGPDDAGGAVGELGHFRLSKQRAVTFLTFAADNRHGLGVVGDVVCVLHVKNGEVLYRFKKHVEPVRCAALSPDGRLALSGEDSGRLCLWDVDTGEEVDWLRSHDGLIGSIAFSPSGRYALSGGDDGVLRLWDLRSGDQLDRFAGRSANDIHHVAFSADGRLALAAGSGGKVRVWDLKAGRALGPFQGASGTITTTAFTADGSLVAARAASGAATGLAVWQWDLRTGKPVACFENPGPTEARVSAVALTRDGVRLVTTGDIKVRVPDAGPSGPRNLPIGGLVGVAINSYLLYKSIKEPTDMAWRHGVQVWNVANGQVVKASESETRPGGCVAIAPDGRTAMTGSKDGTVHVWGLPL